MDIIVPIKLTTTTEDEEKRKKKSQRVYRTSQNIRIINVSLESLLSESFPSLAATVPSSQAPEGQGPPILTNCLLKFWTHCSNCSSFVSSAFPSFWRTFQGRGRREECYTEKESGQTKSTRSPTSQTPLHPSGVLGGPRPGSPSPGHWDHQRACGCCDPQGQH